MASASARPDRRAAPDPEELVVRHGPPVAEKDLPSVSIVILNHNGRQHLAGCFESLRALDYPAERLDVIVVDNASRDGSVEEIRSQHAWVRLHPNDRNLGFTGGCNQGADLARAQGSEVIVFLNNDMRVEPGWLRALVGPVTRGECQATTAKMFDWNGQHIDSAGGGMNFHGIGLQRGYKEKPGPAFDQPRKTLFACGGAMAMPLEIFDEVGGFDPQFFAYYEDVDLGWRMWVQGHQVHYVPEAVCYHRHSSTSRTFPIETLRLLQVRNPLLACFKNYDDDNLRKALPAILGLAVRRTLLVSGLPSDAPFRIEQAEGREPGWLHKLLAGAVGPERAAKLLGRGGAHVPLRRVAVADLIGLNDLLGHWDHWMDRRREVQSRRRRADEEIFRLFLKPLWCVEDDPGYRSLQHGLTAFTGLDQLFEGLTSLDHDLHK